jgi:hypothetical protein
MIFSFMHKIDTSREGYLLAYFISIYMLVFKSKEEKTTITCHKTKS